MLRYWKLRRILRELDEAQARAEDQRYFSTFVNMHERLQGGMK